MILYYLYELRLNLFLLAGEVCRYLVDWCDEHAGRAADALMDLEGGE